MRKVEEGEGEDNVKNTLEKMESFMTLVNQKLNVFLNPLPLNVAPTTTGVERESGPLSAGAYSTHDRIFTKNRNTGGGGSTDLAQSAKR